MKKILLVFVVVTTCAFLSGCGCCNTGATSSCCGADSDGNWY